MSVLLLIDVATPQYEAIRAVAKPGVTTILFNSHEDSLMGILAKIPAGSYATAGLVQEGSGLMPVYQIVKSQAPAKMVGTMELPSLVISDVEKSAVKHVRFEGDEPTPAIPETRVVVPTCFAMIQGSEFAAKVLEQARKEFTETHPEFPRRIANSMIHFGSVVELNELLTCPGNLDRHPGNQAWRTFLYQQIARDGAPNSELNTGWPAREYSLRWPSVACPRS